MLLVAASGQSVRFKTSDVRPMGRTARGVRGIRLAGVKPVLEDAAEEGEEPLSEASEEGGEPEPAAGGADSLRALVKVESDPAASVLLIVENGYGKCTDFGAYPSHRRGGKGVKSIDTGARNGRLVFAGAVHRAVEATETEPATRGDSVMVITEQGLLIRTGVDSIPQTGRIAKGVRVVRLGEGDRVISATVVSNGDEEENGDTPDPASETAPEASSESYAPVTPEASDAPGASASESPESNS